MKIRINDKNGNNIAECELSHHDIGIWYTISKSNIENVYGDIEQGEQGFVDVIDIDVDNLISPKKIDMIKSLASAWGIFEAIRTNYELDVSDDHSYASEIILIPKIYGFITEEEEQKYQNDLNKFLGWNGTFFDCENDYTYEELDNLILGFNKIYER